MFWILINIFLLAPLRAPDLVTVHISRSKALIVEWSHLSEEQFRGKPIGYNVSYYPVDLESDFNFVGVNFSSNTTTLTNLSFYSTYVIKVSAVSSGGIGPANTAKGRTDAGGMNFWKKLMLF